MQIAEELIQTRKAEELCQMRKAEKLYQMGKAEELVEMRKAEKFYQMRKAEELYQMWKEEELLKEFPCGIVYVRNAEKIIEHAEYGTRKCGIPPSLALDLHGIQINFQ